MFKKPGEVKKVQHRFPRRKPEGAVKVDPRIKDSRHIQRWTAGEQGVERYESKETRELDIARAHQDIANEELHRGFDESAKDNHMKYERSSFIVVTSSEAFRDGWEKAFGKKQDGADGDQGSASESTLSA